MDEVQRPIPCYSEPDSVPPVNLKGCPPEKRTLDVLDGERHTSALERTLLVMGGVGIFFLGALGSYLASEYIDETQASPVVTVTLPATTSATREFVFGPAPSLSNPDFFAATLRTFNENNVSFIEADLKNMIIRYHEDQEIVFEAPILTKGREGSWWETPAGLYSIKTKEEEHFSSFGQVYQPWSMSFQGNFFVHGWPHYDNGEPVSSQYSGGCIRLSDEDAEELYSLVAVGTPILVYQDNEDHDAYIYDPPMPTIDATAFLVADVESGYVLLEGGTATMTPMASITKLMTALIAVEYINLDRDVTVTTEMSATTSVPRLTPGMTLSAYSLLKPLLLESSNEAATILAKMVGEERFVLFMNQKAHALGMKETRFTDAAGVRSDNVSTPRDLLRLLTYLQENRSFILRLSSGASVETAYTEHIFEDMTNFNEIPGLTGFVGGKIGKSTVSIYMRMRWLCSA